MQRHFLPLGTSKCTQRKSMAKRPWRLRFPVHWQFSKSWGPVLWVQQWWIIRHLVRDSGKMSNNKSPLCRGLWAFPHPHPAPATRCSEWGERLAMANQQNGLIQTKQEEATCVPAPSTPWPEERLTSRAFPLTQLASVSLPAPQRASAAWTPPAPSLSRRKTDCSWSLPSLFKVDTLGTQKD